jgi:uncharacterized protein YqjF (DUF2071 family)
MISDALELASCVFGQAKAPHRADHRPWPMPKRPWVMAQTWKHLLFAHWRVPVTALEPVVPKALPIDTFAGQAWVAVTPFEVKALRLHGTAPIPFVSSFLEANVRTYVIVDEKPGIFFFSLDAESRLAVAAARRFYRLPYFPATMSAERDGERISYRTRRTQSDAPSAELVAEYRPSGAQFRAEVDSIEHWLTERYCLYTLDEDQRVLRGEIQHPPWSLQAAEAELHVNTMLDETELAVGDPDLLHFAERQDVVFWRLARLDA